MDNPIEKEIRMFKRKEICYYCFGGICILLFLAGYASFSAFSVYGYAVGAASLLLLFISIAFFFAASRAGENIFKLKLTIPPPDSRRNSAK